MKKPFGDFSFKMVIKFSLLNLTLFVQMKTGHQGPKICPSTKKLIVHSSKYLASDYLVLTHYRGKRHLCFQAHTLRIVPSWLKALQYKEKLIIPLASLTKGFHTFHPNTSKSTFLYSLFKQALLPMREYLSGGYYKM